MFWECVFILHVWIAAKTHPALLNSARYGNINRLFSALYTDELWWMEIVSYSSCWSTKLIQVRFTVCLVSVTKTVTHEHFQKLLSTNKIHVSYLSAVYGEVYVPPV